MKQRLSLADLRERLLSGGRLDSEECAAAVSQLLDSGVSPSLKSDFLIAQMQRGLCRQELVAFARALLPRAVDPGFHGQWQGTNLLDCCGTGGGGLNILNISTGIVFILAALGVPVVKHGNRGVTKKSGSADVIEALGLAVVLSPTELQQSLEELGWGFIYAPHYHPGFAVLAPIRKELGARGQKTIFNYLGPLLNPTRPASQLVGVFDSDKLDLYDQALKELGCARSLVVKGQVGGQEIGEVGVVTQFSQPQSSSLPPLVEGNIEELRVDGAEQSAARLLRLLSGSEKGFARELLLANAAVALCVQGKALELHVAWELAREALDSGAAVQVLKKSRHRFPLRK